MQPATVLPFSSEEAMARLGDDENPLHIVNEDEDDSAWPSSQEQGGAAATDFSDSLQFSVDENIIILDSDLHQPSTDTHPHATIQQQRTRPFGSAAEYLQIKRAQKEAQRAQAQRLSIRQLSAFLGKKMQ
eukprot:COSAG02_NODE_23283_length_723_cov_1.623397_2_plen_130_part_00